LEGTNRDGVDGWVSGIRSDDCDDDVGEDTSDTTSLVDLSISIVVLVGVIGRMNEPAEMAFSI
jgi:hypothetical protein